MFTAAKKAEKANNPNVQPDILIEMATDGKTPKSLNVILPMNQVEAALRPSAKGTETGFNVSTGVLKTADGKSFRMRFGWFALTEL